MGRLETSGSRCGTMADKNGAGKSESGGRAAIGATAIKPDTKEGFAGFLEFLFNKKTGEVLGRSAKSWAQITLFYIVTPTTLASCTTRRTSRDSSSFNFSSIPNKRNQDICSNRQLVVKTKH